MAVSSADIESDNQSEIVAGVLFSQSGPMAVTEVAHLKGTLIAIDEVNERGVPGGVPLRPAIEDPRSDPSLYRDLARKLLTEDRVSVIFGCCSSASRKAVLPVVERHGAVLFYPSFYEGFEYSSNIVYTGATPNQTVIPLVKYIFENFGKKISFVGSDYIFAHEVNRIIKEFLVESGGSVVDEMYLPQGGGPELFVGAAKTVKQSHPDVLLSTVVGNDTAKLYEACRNVGIDPAQCPIASLTTSESELATMDPPSRAGHITALSYFQSLDTEANRNFLDRYRRRYGADDVPCIYSETAYFQVHLLVRALNHSTVHAPETLLDAIKGAGFDAPQGRIMVDPDNNHVYVTPRLGLSTGKGTFDIVWEAPEPVKPDPYLVAYDRTISVSPSR